MVRNSELPPLGGFAQAYARAVRDAVAAAGVSGNQLSKRMGRAQSYVSLRLQGRRAWTLDELDEIARIIDVPISELMDRAHPDR